MPTAQCAVADRETALLATLDGVVDTSLIETPNTPQANAFDWLLMTDTGTDPCDSLQVVQRYALAVFYESTNGDDWVVNDGWLSESRVCDWFEVGCLADGLTVYQIDLFDNNLSGTLPTELGALSTMLGFNVFLNSLTGTVPNYFSTWPSLVLFDVENNTLTGDPLLWLGNEINSNDDEDNLVPDLRFYRTSFNQFQGSITPAALRQLSGVEHLWIAGNQYSGELPSDLGQLTLLSKFCFVSPLMRKNSSPTHVFFSSSEQLFLYDNLFIGALPDVFDKLDLVRMQIQNNKFSGTLPPTLYSNSNLEELRIDHNDFEGTLSGSIGDLESLRDLRLSSNRLSGSIPTNFAALTDLGKSRESLIY